MGDARCLVWSDVPGDCMWRWDEQTGAASVFRRPSGYANGNTRDRLFMAATTSLYALYVNTQGVAYF